MSNHISDERPFEQLPDGSDNDRSGQPQPQLPGPSSHSSVVSQHAHEQPPQLPTIPTSDGIGQQTLLESMASDTRSSSKPASKRKKGTATTVKAPKRARPNGGKKGKTPGPGGGAKKKMTIGSSPAPYSNGTDDGDGSVTGTVDGGDGSSESDSGPYCLCRGPDNHRFMIACDRCEDWFHGECIGMDKYTGENLVQRYICPNCSDGKRYVTRYKKMCSLEACVQPARVYDPTNPSMFCSQDHCQAWWEQLIATLPRTKTGASIDKLTQGEFIGLLDTPTRAPGDKEASWKFEDTPFGVSDDFWDKVDLNEVFTPEERGLLDSSAEERHSLVEEMGLYKKMLQLIEMALKRREAAIAAGKGAGMTKDVCGYDTRLDTVCTTHQFAAFLKSPTGQAIFKSGRIDPPELGLPAPLISPAAPLTTAENSSAVTPGAAGSDDGGGGMWCTKKKCKTHHLWGAILAKQVKHTIKELAAQAKEKVDVEERIRNSAAGRFRRKMKENNNVVVFDDSDGDDEMS
ncbi:hypothetical protein B0H66DRAFT_598067 [Apodospora peruviana]|uniref:PHD-type domain-containing protein n=1 Tax=Apodospora peruviana TaxID=516989 RepID=A0AAE0IT44_9PEZI|nr:hypothetical protein B0H66DRAFT_598067 [Apodospora peruviana]